MSTVEQFKTKYNALFLKEPSNNPPIRRVRLGISINGLQLSGLIDLDIGATFHDVVEYLKFIIEDEAGIEDGSGIEDAEVLEEVTSSEILQRGTLIKLGKNNYLVRAQQSNSKNLVHQVYTEDNQLVKDENTVRKVLTLFQKDS